ncbi:malonyl-CoA--acyl carrier protein transacylase [Geotalea daltonii FRC-32]|uniref:[acyl-carrier-protein] S-malonyltransferase n=2 Tax=Geotalea TaxID=2910589 RepID=B9M7H6_GEODF|nr:malonyl-CoA--acyl carrier protein transacylase [Geotalea daltonii FRC-32]
MFPGQPLARGAALPPDEGFTTIAELVRQKAGFDLLTSSWLREASTENVGLQLYGVGMSLYMNRKMRSAGIQPAVVAEHSMGIYPALAACSSLPEAEVIELTWRVGACLAEMGKNRGFALGCIIGLTCEPVLAIAGNSGTHLANHNTSRHFLLCGTKENIETAVAEALAQGAFSAKVFDCDAPLHTPLISELETPLRQILADYSYAEPCGVLIDHLEQNRLKAKDLPDFMFRQLCMPVYWERTYRALVSMGAKRFHEVGAGEALKKYNRWIASETDQK